MADVTKKSNGLLGLSHFRNSRVATSLWEPIYQNLFSVQLVPPMGLEDRSDEYYTDETEPYMNRLTAYVSDCGISEFDYEP